MQDFSLLIRLWYRQNYRSLPWRNTTNPYFIWLSEIILQQTRVEQGRSYYEKFVNHYPTVMALANADEQDVLNDWQGLGYYSRARNLHFAAQQVVDTFDGQFPENYKDIRSLKGVGAYTSAAIASFAFDLPHAVVDGNVYRVLSRYYADDSPIDTSQGQKLFKMYAQELLSEDEPAEHNQAIMELGALICKPKNPLCHECPVSESCLAYRSGEMLSYPVKSKKTKVRDRYFNYLVAGDREFQLEKRSAKGIWQNMYQFPLFETDKKLSQSKLKEQINAAFGIDIKKQIASYTHVLSHQRIHTVFWSFEGEMTTSKELLKVDVEQVDRYPLPRLIHRFFEENNPEYGSS